tara:strand:- start:46 stop:360 length:315 start_codon:yes stop_codon:yes gene_type:complete
MKVFRFVPYILFVIILKPIITWFAYPKGNTTVKNFNAPRKDWIYDGYQSPFGYHIDEYFDYHNEVFFYSLILVGLIYSIVNYKTLTNIDSKKSSKWLEEPKMKE